MAAANMLAQRIHAESEKALNEHAREALLRPKTDHDPAFAYGEVCGFQKGMTTAFQLVQQLLNDEDQRNERRPEPTEFD